MPGHEVNRLKTLFLSLVQAGVGSLEGRRAGTFPGGLHVVWGSE